MKKLTYLVSLMFAAMLLIASCSKDDTASDTNVDPTIVKGCKLTVLSDDMNKDGNQLDSTFYIDNKISKVKSYEYRGATKTIILIGIDRYEYSGNDIKLYSYAQHNGTHWTERLDNIYSFKDSKISQISSYEESFVTGEANFNYRNTHYYYTADKIKYILKMEEDPQTGLPSVYAKDSTVVTYDANGDNIVKADFYKYDFKLNLYYQLFTNEYTFDNKTNPLKNFFPYIDNPYYEYDDAYIYFNKNNIVSHTYTTKDGISKYSNLYTFDENNLPIRIANSELGYPAYFKNYSYNCN